MKNTLSLIFAGAVLAAGSLFAAVSGDVVVNLPHAVTVGSTVLPSGAYTLSPVESADGLNMFVLRGGKTAPIMIPAQKIEGGAATKTSVTLSESGDTWRLEKLSIAGESTAYEFGN